MENLDFKILHFSRVGFEIEFFSKLSITETKRKIASELGKKIQVFDKAHSEFIPTDRDFKLEKDYSGGEKMVELVTGPLDYVESKLILIKALRWISENGSTSDRCSIHINISFKDEFLNKNIFRSMNILKFILDFDEEYIYKLFPKRKNSVYARSIKYVVPINKLYVDDIKKFLETKVISTEHFILPRTKYYGVNFSKLLKDYLEFRYLGGKDYETRSEDIQNIVDFSILSTYKSVTNPGYTDENREELKRIFKFYEKMIDAYKSPDDLKKNFPGINFTVDKQYNLITNRLYYDRVRDKIFQLLSEAGAKKGWINYDSDTGKVQIKDFTLKKCYEVSHMDIVDCKITGVIIDCDMFDSETTFSEIHDSRMFGDTMCKKSKLSNSYVSKNVELNDCYVYGRATIMLGKMFGGIFRQGMIERQNKISKDTEVVEFDYVN